MSVLKRQVRLIRKKHALSEPAARLIAELHFGGGRRS